MHQGQSQACPAALQLSACSCTACTSAGPCACSSAGRLKPSGGGHVQVRVRAAQAKAGRVQRAPAGAPVDMPGSQQEPVHDPQQAPARARDAPETQDRRSSMRSVSPYPCPQPSGPSVPSADGPATPEKPEAAPGAPSLLGKLLWRCSTGALHSSSWGGRAQQALPARMHCCLLPVPSRCPCRPRSGRLLRWPAGRSPCRLPQSRQQSWQRRQCHRAQCLQSRTMSASALVLLPALAQAGSACRLQAAQQQAHGPERQRGQRAPHPADAAPGVDAGHPCRRERPKPARLSTQLDMQRVYQSKQQDGRLGGRCPFLSKPGMPSSRHPGSCSKRLTRMPF